MTQGHAASHDVFCMNADRPIGLRLHRLNDGKRVVQVYDYIDPNVVVLARMYERRLKGYDVIGYTVEQPLRASSANLTG
jgi:hypothetical protein